MNEFDLRIRLIKKKVRDLRLKNKIQISFLFITILTVFAVALLSYEVAKREMVRNSYQTVTELEKQGSERLGERKREFEESSYRILHMSNVEPLLAYSEQEARMLKNRNEGLPSTIMQQSLLLKYTRFALLQPVSGVVYDYYHSGEAHLNESSESEILRKLDDRVDKHDPVVWEKIGEDIYFARQIVSPTNFVEEGIIIFCVDEEFFSFLGNDISYLDENNSFVLDKKGNFLKGGDNKNNENVHSFVSEVDWNVNNYAAKAEGDLLVSASMSDSSGWITVVCYSKTILLSGVSQIFRYVLVVLACTLVMGILLSEFLSKTIAQNTDVIEKGMKEFEDGNFRYRISPVSYDEVGLLGLQLNFMAEKIEQLMERQRADEENKRQMEIATLQAQINPHFLYNTLGSMKWLAYKNGDIQLSDTLDALVQLLRFTIKRAGAMVTVSEEIDYIKSYADIERMRYENGFSITYEIDDAVLCENIPGFILQPMVENSLLHGLDMTKPDAKIIIRAGHKYENENEFLVIDVEDNGVGMDEKTLLELRNEDKPQKNGFSSIGVSIVSKRLREMYGESFRMDISSSQGNGTKISLWIPGGNR